MTTHDLAVDWVAEKTHGLITHRRIGERRLYPIYGLRKEPDVVVRPDYFSLEELHEIEVLASFNKSKVDSYRSAKCGKKTLWIVVPNGTSDLFTIRVIEACDFERFVEVTPGKRRRRVLEADEE